MLYIIVSSTGAGEKVEENSLYRTGNKSDRSIYQSPARLLFIIIFSVFIAETLIMAVLSFYPHISAQTWIFLDAALLVIILSPVLYCFVFKPLLLQINERKQAEEKAKLAYAELRQVFHTAADGIRLIDCSSNILRVNETFAQMSGVSKEEAKGKKCYEVFPGPQCHTAKCSLQRVLSGEEHIEFEALRENRKGDKIPCIVTATPFRSPDGEFVGIVEDFRDISKRKKAEKALKESEEKLNAMLQSITDHMSMIDKDFTIVWVNDVEVNFLGYNPVGKKCYEAYYNRTEPCEPYPCFMLKALQDGKVYERDTRLLSKDGKEVYFHCTANVALMNKESNPAGALIISRDVTESKKLEQQLMQAQKMEAIGQLAGGIAHDFNNILTAIIGYSHMLQMEMEFNETLNGYLTYILNSAQRAANLTHALLAFSRTQIIDTKPVDVNEIILVLEKLLTRLIGEDIELSTHLTHKDTVVMADTTQIEQALMNLATNARDAMPDGGSLIISTDSVSLDDDFVNTYGFGKQGNYAMISFADTGQGMDDATRERIFEPFFTTKEVGKGTGLGLAMVYGIVKQHEGFINVYSEPGKGTTFKIYLPLSTSKVEQLKQVERDDVKGGTETILVIEDDAQVRDLTKKVLERVGYRVIEAVDGSDAVRVFHDYKNIIDLVILDVIMPKKNGKEVYEDLKKEQPGVKVLFTSGYTADIIQKKGILKDSQNFISKPVSPGKLLETVRNILKKEAGRQTNA
jgi:two-component system cell cycle sensor histidine kinase/response regulator CckA